MDSVTFKRIARNEWRVYHDGDIVGDVCRQDDILQEGEHYYVVHLSEDYRGPLRVHDRRTRPRGDRTPDPLAPVVVSHGGQRQRGHPRHPVLIRVRLPGGEARGPASRQPCASHALPPGGSG